MVVVVVGFVVDVVVGAIEVVVEDAGTELLVLDAGMDVAVVPAAVVVVVATGVVPPASTLSSDVMTEVGGFGSCVLSGTNPTVMS
ncbi:MAG TPA: hypothetical protein VHD39_00345, partial [Acidimicrobiales bacterium]|nr:hypothetical protein [Acidimicrobiales bacterium]